jgi:predicted RNase H-like HicB family nuclease
MSEGLRQQAEELAARPYSMRLIPDNSIPGESLYLALNPELDGCMAQGRTSKEALDYLDEVRIDHIEHLLEHGLPVPEPASMATTTGPVDYDERSTLVWEVSPSKHTVEGKIESAAQPEDRGDLVIELPGIHRSALSKT